MLTEIIFVCLLKSIRILSFILIGGCLNELHINLCPYSLRLFIVLHELCLPNYLHVSIITVIGFHHFTMFHYSIPSRFRDGKMYCLRMFIVVSRELESWIFRPLIEKYSRITVSYLKRLTKAALG